MLGGCVAVVLPGPKIDRDAVMIVDETHNLRLAANAVLPSFLSSIRN